jgi:hypothetical protein
MQNPSSVPHPPAPDPAVPPPAPPPAALSPWAWVAAVVLGQPTAHRLVHAFFLGLIGLVTVLVGAARGCG